MFFKKVFIVSGLLWASFVIPFEGDKQQDDFKGLAPKAMMISAATGAMSGVIDAYTLKHIGLPFGFFGEPEIRRLALEELLFSNRESIREVDKRSAARQITIAVWFGRGVSWIAWGIAWQYFKNKV